MAFRSPCTVLLVSYGEINYIITNLLRYHFINPRFYSNVPTNLIPAIKLLLLVSVTQPRSPSDLIFSLFGVFLCDHFLVKYSVVNLWTSSGSWLGTMRIENFPITYNTVTEAPIEKATFPKINNIKSESLLTSYWLDGATILCSLRAKSYNKL